MIVRTCGLVLALGLAASCGQEMQQLPFDLDGPAERSVPPGGGIVSTPAGASVEFPAGALRTTAAVKLESVPVPAAARASGTPASAAFRLEPAATRLDRPARVQVRFDPASAGARGWLATLVNVTHSGTRELPNTRIVFSSALAESRVGEFGTFAVVVPGDDVVFGVRRGSMLVEPGPPTVGFSLAASGTDSVSVRCGDPDNRCSGVSVDASANLLDLVEDAAALYPRLEGALRISGTSAAGRIALTTSLRVKLRSGEGAENVEIDAEVTPTSGTRVSETAAELRFTAMRFRIRGAQEAEDGVHEEIADLVIPKWGTPAIAITRTFQIRNAAGALEPASTTLTFPVQVHQ